MDSYLPYQSPTTVDKKLDSESLLVGSDTVERERVQIAGASALEIATVKNSDPASNAYGMTVRDPGLNSRIGEVQASPTANTVLDRLKALLTGIVLAAGSNLIGKVKLRNPGDTADMGDATNPVRTDPTGTTTQPVSAASLPLPTGAATEATLDARTGSLTEAAPASDTASSGLNGRLQRVAQRLTSLIGLVPSALTGSGNFKAALVESTTTVTTKEARAATPAQSSVAGSASSVSLLASNSNRLGATIYNDSTADLYLKLGATASTSSFTVKLTPNAYYEAPFNYTGAIDGIWSSATGNARITELTA